MTGHKIIRNSDGSAYVVDRTGKHVATHDSAADAREHLNELREAVENHKKMDNKEHSKIAGDLARHITKDTAEHKRLEERISHDPYYSNPRKNK